MNRIKCERNYNVGLEAWVTAWDPATDANDEHKAGSSKNLLIYVLHLEILTSYCL